MPRLLLESLCFRLTEVAKREMTPMPGNHHHPTTARGHTHPTLAGSGQHPSLTAAGSGSHPSLATTGSGQHPSLKQEQEDCDQPLDMSRTSRTIAHQVPAARPEDDQKQLFSGLYLLVDTAVGVLEAQRTLPPLNQPCQA